MAKKTMKKTKSKVTKKAKVNKAASQKVTFKKQLDSAKTSAFDSGYTKAIKAFLKEFESGMDAIHKKLSGKFKKAAGTKPKAKAKKKSSVKASAKSAKSKVTKAAKKSSPKPMNKMRAKPKKPVLESVANV